MTLPQPAPRRKRRLGLFGPFMLLAVVAVGWTVGWFWLAGEAERRMDAQADALRTAGYALEWDGRVVGGYPFRLDVSLKNARIAEPSGWGLSAPALEAEAFVYALDHWVAYAPQGIQVVRPQGGALNISGEVVRASLTDFDKVVPRVAFEGRKLAFTPGPGAQPFFITKAEGLDLQLRPGPDDQAAVLMRATGATARLSGLFAQVAGGKPIDVNLETILSKASAIGGRDWPTAVRAWAGAGGALSVRTASIAAGEAIIEAKSPRLGVGPDGRLAGEMTVGVKQAPQAMAALGETGAVTPQAATAAAAAATIASGGTGEFSAPLTFRDGLTMLGPLPLAKSPRVY